jgi:hypothetical protein
MRFVGTHDSELMHLAIIAFQTNPGAEKYAIGARWFFPYDGEFVEPMRQVLHTTIDFAKLFLSVDIFGVFGPVSLCRGFGNLVCHTGSLDFP